MFCLKLDLPTVPEDLIPSDTNDLEVIRLIHTDYGNDFYLNNKKLSACKYISHSIDRLISWVDDNITNDYVNVVLQTQYAGKAHIVHSDIRAAALNYVINTGGSNVITTWYKEKDKKLYRPKFQEGVQISKQEILPINYYDNLEQVHQEKFQKNTWYLLNTHVLHDVQNLESRRIAISISLSSDQIKKFNSNFYNPD